jgi:hypothetical protein
LVDFKVVIMRLKLLLIFAILLSYAVVTFSSGSASTLHRTNLWSMFDGTDPPHAVDTSGKAIPESSSVQPDKPIILAKDSNDENFGELKPEAAFDHVKHTTDVKYSIDGKTLTACIECHHTAQPSAPIGQEYLKKFDRKETLTAKQLETSKEPVQSCRACHFQSSTKETGGNPPKSVTYPKKMEKKPTGKLINKIAYHLNCNSCHDAVAKRDPKSKAPTGCADCHTQKE